MKQKHTAWIITLTIIGIVLISACVQQESSITNNVTQNEPYCGDGICEENENCQEDCKIEVEMSSEDIYSKYKDSVFYIDMYCNLTLSYPSFKITYDYDNYYYDDHLQIDIEEQTQTTYFEYVSGAVGTGFIIDDKVITNAHTAYCEKDDELLYIQGHLNYLLEVSTNYYINQTDLELLTDYDIAGKTNEIYNHVKQNNRNTEWTKTDIEDYLAQQISYHLVTNIDISRVKEDVILAYSPTTGFDKEYVLSIVEKGNHWPGKDYAILEFDGNYDFVSLQYGDSDEVRIGQEIYTIGYPDSFVLDYNVFSDPSITKGIVSSRQNTEKGIQYIQIDAATSGGSSGSPVFNKFGKVIGIMTAGYGESFNSVLPSNSFKR